VNGIKKKTCGFRRGYKGDISEIEVSFLSEIIWKPRRAVVKTVKRNTRGLETGTFEKRRIQQMVAE